MGRWRLWKHLPDFDNLLRFSLEEMLSNSDFFEEPFDISAHFLAPNFQWQMTHLQKSSIGGNKIRYFALFYSTTMYCACSLHQDYSKKKFLQDNWPAAKDPVPRAKFELEQRTEKPEKLGQYHQPIWMQISWCQYYYSSYRPVQSVRKTLKNVSF